MKILIEVGSFAGRERFMPFAPHKVWGDGLIPAL